ncbi:hypothetical protein [Nostoc sp. UHCC 0870]|uniref:hypothetical protein n=1 Tax=Nostoc sp. UHCC 0870 TaxID=2914041 RepID=UPI001EE11081|nr:hypothetical protein [Nostoc sp. UHCC 0870]UKO97701.1 hypothetical protein L6494_24535 [Nostoc sp. UHCC 0870]
MDELESKIIEILKRGTPLRAVNIAQMLGIERREVNHYLYSSLKHLVLQDSEFRWSLKSDQAVINQRISNRPPTAQSKPSTPIYQDTSYRFTKKEIQQDFHIKPPVSQPPKSQPVRQANPYEVVKQQLSQVSTEEKIKILEGAFRQDKFTELEDEQIYALQSILEEAKHEVNIANNAYQQGQLSFWKANRLAIAAISIALSLGTIFVVAQLRSNSTYQPTPTLPQSR